MLLAIMASPVHVTGYLGDYRQETFRFLQTFASVTPALPQQSFHTGEA